MQFIILEVQFFPFENINKITKIIIRFNDDALNAVIHCIFNIYELRCI